MVLETEKRQCVQWWFANILSVFLIVGLTQIPINLQINAKYGMMGVTIVSSGLKLRPISPQLLGFSLMTQLILLRVQHALRELASDKILQSAWNGKIALLMEFNRIKLIKSKIFLSDIFIYNSLIS